jgi:hypothetical protein
MHVMRRFSSSLAPRTKLVASRGKVCLLLLPLGAVLFALFGMSEPSHNVFIVTPTGTPAGDGSWDRPWDLATALSHPSTVQPGDIIWLRKGSYAGQFESKLEGAPGNPITVRAWPQERVTIDVSGVTSQGQGFVVRGHHSSFRDLEIACSRDASRRSESRGSHPEDIQRGQITDYGSFNRFINLIVHDLNKGFGMWSSGTGGEIYGCIIYNNGWSGPDRRHGPGIYVQNEAGSKTIANNIIFHQFSRGIQAYASSAGHMHGLKIEGNVVFNSGGAAGARYEPSPDITVGGGSEPSDISVRGNFTYQNGLDGVVFLGWASAGRNIVIDGNYFVGGTFFPTSWSRIHFMRNTIVAHQSPAVVIERPQLIDQAEWDNNRYQSSREKPFHYRGSGRSWFGWREESQWDQRSEFLSGPADDSSVFVRPNAYELGRAHVVVYNWGLDDHVDVDLSEVLRRGDEFVVHHVFDLFGRPVAEGRFEGQPIRLDLCDRRAPPPIGYNQEPATLTREFAVFLVRKK